MEGTGKNKVNCLIYWSIDTYFSGYSVGSLISSTGSQLYMAGAPRFNHTGKVVVFTLKNSGELTVLQALLGEQVSDRKHIDITFMYIHTCYCLH